jgi:hypothetical protein
MGAAVIPAMQEVQRELVIGRYPRFVHLGAPHRAEASVSEGERSRDVYLVPGVVPLAETNS